MTNAVTKIEALQGYTALTERVSIYIPSTTNVNKTTDNSVFVKLIAKTLSQLFGGATAQAASGFWMSKAAGLVQEDVTIIYAACTPEALTNHAAEIVELCENLKHDMGQEAISLDINGTLYLI